MCDHLYTTFWVCTLYNKDDTYMMDVEDDLTELLCLQRAGFRTEYFQLYFVDYTHDIMGTISIEFPSGVITALGIFENDSDLIKRCDQGKRSQEPIRLVLVDEGISFLLGWQTYIDPKRANQGQSSERLLLRVSKKGTIAILDNFYSKD